MYLKIFVKMKLILFSHRIQIIKAFLRKFISAVVLKHYTKTAIITVIIFNSVRHNNFYNFFKSVGTFNRRFCHNLLIII